jgi:glutamyl-tRNA reductase
MPILACGINHKTAPVALREKVVFAPDKLNLYLNDLGAEAKVQDAVILSTCNRSELYCVGETGALIKDWYQRQHQVTAAVLDDAFYLYEGNAAVQHIMQVACGLDSMVLGESQILGQMKDAFAEAMTAGMIGPTFNRLFQQVFMVAKDVRHSTALGACPVSVSSAAVQFLKENYPGSLQDANLLVLGAGSTIDLVFRHLKNMRPKSIVIANRNVQNAETLSLKYEASALSLDNLAAALPEIDILLAATGSPRPILTQDMCGSRTKPLFIIDIAVPRDVAPEVATSANVQLFSIDDLKTIIQHNLQGREHAADKAREMIKQKSQDFITWLDSENLVATTISAYRRQIEELCLSELTKARLQIARGIEPEAVLGTFAKALTNKLLHAPSVQLRQAGLKGRLEVLHLAKELFAIPEPELTS